MDGRKIRSRTGTESGNDHADQVCLGARRCPVPHSKFAKNKQIFIDPTSPSPIRRKEVNFSSLPNPDKTGQKPDKARTNGAKPGQNPDKHARANMVNSSLAGVSSHRFHAVFFMPPATLEMNTLHQSWCKIGKNTNRPCFGQRWQGHNFFGWLTDRWSGLGRLARCTFSNFVSCMVSKRY